MKERGNEKLKFIDKFIGVPMVFTLGLLRKRNREKLVKPENIIIVMIAAIGDTILLSSIIKELKHLYPRVNITLVCSNGNIQAAKNLPYINKIIKFDMTNVTGSLLELRKENTYDLLLDFGAWSRLNAILSYVIKADLKVGFKRKDMSRHYIYDQIVEHVDDIHEIENYRNILRSLGYSLLGEKPEFTISVDNVNNVRTILVPKHKYIIFHLFASGSHKAKKEWPESSWIDLADWLIGESYKIILTGGKQDSEIAHTLVKKINGIEGLDYISLSGKLSLAETAALIKEVGTIVTVNTGIMHLAAAVDAKIIALHGPTSPLRWGPISDKSVILTPNIACDQLLSLGFEKHNCVINDGCISTIKVDDVYQAVKNNLGHHVGGNFEETSSVF